FVRCCTCTTPRPRDGLPSPGPTRYMERTHPSQAPWPAWVPTDARVSPASLPVQPQGGGAAAIVPARLGAIVLDIRRPGSGDDPDARVHVVLLLRHIPLDVEDELLPRLQILR